VYGDEIIPANLDIQYITLLNGEWYGVFYGGTATGNITNCNFINNGYGVQLYDFAEIQIRNSNFVENTIYGVALVSTTPVCSINYSNAWGNGEAPWGENCPG
jgi:parallel beta-helix repeat protein